MGFGVFQGLEGSGYRWRIFGIKIGLKRGGLAFLIGIPLFWAVAHVRDCVIYRFWGCFRVWRDLG